MALIRVVAMSSGDECRGWRRRWRSFPLLQCSLGRLGFVGGVAAQVNLVPSAVTPTSSYIALCDGGPPTMVWLGAPDQGARSSPFRPLGRDGVEIELTFSPSISSYLFLFFSSSLDIHFITNKYIEHRLSRS